MKVKVKDLRQNPYRNMDKYPLDRGKIDALKASISETDFWDNLLARKKNGHYQIAYGHHRLIALQELKIEEVDIPIRNLDDATMIKIMANENMEYWKMDENVRIETVRVVRDFLNAELAKYETWEEAPRSLMTSLSLDGRHTFQDLKQKGVGQTTILKFLGGAWSQWSIQKSLESLDGEPTEIEIAKTFNSPNLKTHFKEAIERIKEDEPRLEITKEKELIVAKKIKARIDSFKTKKKEEKVTGVSDFFSPTIKTMIKQELEEKEDRDMEIEDITLQIQNIYHECKRLSASIDLVNNRLNELQIERIKNFPAELFALNAFTTLLNSMDKLANYLGLKITLKGDKNE